jgi:hypothetical protein
VTTIIRWDGWLSAARSPHRRTRAAVHRSKELQILLDSVQDKARAVLRSGWRPAYAGGPSRDELVGRLLRPAR